MYPQNCSHVGSVGDKNGYHLKSADFLSCWRVFQNFDDVSFGLGESCACLVFFSIGLIFLLKVKKISL